MSRVGIEEGGLAAGKVKNRRMDYFGGELLTDPPSGQITEGGCQVTRHTKKSTFP